MVYGTLLCYEYSKSNSALLFLIFFATVSTIQILEDGDLSDHIMNFVLNGFAESKCQITRLLLDLEDMSIAYTHVAQRVLMKNKCPR